jgi:hypothetical protein
LQQDSDAMRFFAEYGTLYAYSEVRFITNESDFSIPRKVPLKMTDSEPNFSVRALPFTIKEVSLAIEVISAI